MNRRGWFICCTVRFYRHRLFVYCTRVSQAAHPGLTMGRCKVLMQGKLFQRCTHLLYCSLLSLGGNVNTRRMSQPDMGSIFHIKNQWNILVIGNCYVNYQYIKIKCFYPLQILNENWCIYSCLQIPPRENWFQYVCRVYTTVINFPCIITLV